MNDRFTHDVAPGVALTLALERNGQALDIRVVPAAEQDRGKSVGRIGIAVRAGAAKPDISNADALRETLLKAKSIGYSASVSGQYFTQQLVQRLGIADQVLGKCKVVAGGVGVVVARGELELAVQQMSELLPVAGLAHITPLPPEVQIVSVFSAGVAASCPDAAMAREVIRFLSGPQAADAIRRSGLEPAR